MSVFGRDLAPRAEAKCVHCDWQMPDGTNDWSRQAAREHADKTGHIAVARTIRTRVFKRQPEDAVEVDLQWNEAVS